MLHTTVQNAVAENNMFASEVRKLKANPHKKVVYVFDLGGNFIQEFESASSADLSMGLTLGNVSKYCRDGKVHRGYIWKYHM